MMRRRARDWVVRVPVLMALVAGPFGLSGTAGAQSNIAVEPNFDIWDVQIGQPVTAVSDSVAAIIACGTNGGPTSIELKSFGDWEKCTPEPTGLREIAFTYDDEQDYIARALELEFRALAGGTSMYAHPVVVSMLVDDNGVTQGIRVITDDRANDRDRRMAVVLSKNLQARFSPWNLQCREIPMKEGEQPVGSTFIHDSCTGTNPDGSGQRVLIEGSYLRKKGQEGLNLDTQQVNTGYWESKTRMEVLNPPYSPSGGS
jgi:hypothetical protein